MYSTVLPRFIPSVLNNPDHNIPCICNIHIKTILVRNNYRRMDSITYGPHQTWTLRSRHWVKLCSLLAPSLTQHVPLGNERNASRMDHSFVDSKLKLSQHKVIPNACTASPMDLGALVLLKYCSLYFVEGIPSLTYSTSLSVMVNNY
jgi:hypothetical protein